MEKTLPFTHRIKMCYGLCMTSDCCVRKYNVLEAFGCGVLCQSFDCGLVCLKNIYKNTRTEAFPPSYFTQFLFFF